jgi:ureidoglycolate amidohydrolase
MIPKLTIDSARLLKEIDELAGLSETPLPAVTRVLFSKQDLEARAWMERKCLELGLEVRTDSIGNFFARWMGSEPGLAPIATGSHIDAIPNAGRYDGVLGVLGALEAFRALKTAGFVPRRSLELIVFTAEEPTRFGLGCLGSRLLSGTLPVALAEALRVGEGVGLKAWLEKSPWPKAPLESVRLSRDFYRAFVELHIEQGPLLERDEIDVGIVEKIAAPSAFRLRFEGVGGHAGGVLMPHRHDALMGACEVALEIEAAARESASPDTVATVGVLRLEPNAINSIPFRVLMEVDLRDTDVEARGLALARIQEEAEAICRRRGLTLAYESISLDPPALAAPELVDSLLQHAGQNGLSSRRMVSRAYHDSLFMAVICPMTMIFIPCRGGVSHRPDEYSSPEQMAAGVSVLARALADWSVSL